MSRPLVAPFQGRSPQISSSSFLAPTATVVGDVVLGDESSVWYGSVVRGDVGPIRIGRRTNIQDLCVLHLTGGGTPLVIGDEVTVGHRVILHGATVRDRCLIGMGSILLDGCVIGEESLVGAGSVVLEGTEVPRRSFFAGVPARLKGPIPDSVFARLRESAEGYVRLAREHAALLAMLLVLFLAPAGSRAADQEQQKQYPPTKAAELKARLLDRPSAPDAPSWASQYVTQPELDRLDPIARAAERVWAANTGLAAGAHGDEQKRLRQVLEAYERCPLDSLALKRAATGLVRIGVVIPLTGKFDRYGKTFSQGLRLAMEEHNREWAPNLSLTLYDSEGDPLVGARKARWLLRDHGVSVLIGELFSANTAPLAAASQVVGAVLISPSATNERLATLGDAVFQLHLGNSVLADALTRAIAKELPGAPVGILSSDTRDDSLRALAVVNACKAAGMVVTGKEVVPENTVDLSKALGSLRDKHTGALVLVAPKRLAGIAAAQLPGSWPKARVFGFDELDPASLNAEARAALEGAVYVAADYALTGAPRDSFANRYQKAYGEPPTRMSVRGYLVGLSVTRAVERGSLTAGMLREALRTELYDSDEGRSLRALRPMVSAEPERYVIRSGKAVAAGVVPLSP